MKKYDSSKTYYDENDVIEYFHLDEDFLSEFRDVVEGIMCLGGHLTQDFSKNTAAVTIAKSSARVHYSMCRYASPMFCGDVPTILALIEDYLARP